MDFFILGKNVRLVALNMKKETRCEKTMGLLVYINDELAEYRRYRKIA